MLPETVPCFFFLFYSAWYDNSCFLFIPKEQPQKRKKKTAKDLIAFRSRPKMAEVLTPFCASFFSLGGRIPAYSVSEAAGGCHICGHLCAVPSCEEQQPAYTGIARWNGLSFWQKNPPKNEMNFWHRTERLFVFSSFDHMLESEEASELFVGLFHVIVSFLFNLYLPLSICL